MAPSHSAVWLAIAAQLVLLGQAAPAPAPVADPAPHPMITPAPTLDNPTKTLKERDLLDSIAGGVSSVLSGLGSAIPSYVASGVPNFFQDFPTNDKVRSSLGLDDAQVSALPTQVLNVPPYGNWSNGAWNIRFRGNVYKQPNPDNQTLDSFANKFLIDTQVKDLPPEGQELARNMSRSIYILQQDGQNVTMRLEPAPSAGSSGQTGGGGGAPASGGSQEIKLRDRTTDQGDFDIFQPIQLNGLTAGDQAQQIQKLNVYATGSEIGNATAYLVPPSGITIISDIDDILRVTKIYQPKQGLLNSFARPFVPWMNMPSIYETWSKTIPNAHFHYLTTTPEQVTRTYMDFIFKTYPGGSFDTRPLNFSDVTATLQIRKFLLTKIFQTFPQRKFILVGDTSNSDIMKGYPELVTDFPGQVQCILLRNTSATDDDKFPYDTKGFKGFDPKMYMFFKVPDDLTNIDVAGGNCLNKTIPQNVTFGIQDELLGIHGAAGRHGASWAMAMLVAGLVASILCL